MVLIDTTGVAPRDPRKDDILDVLDLPGVQRLLVVNAGSQGDTLDDAAGLQGARLQAAILSKVDEAVKLGPALDALIRHQMQLRGVTNGQRVPEDFERANAQELIASSMRPHPSAFDPSALDLDFFFAESPRSAGGCMLESSSHQGPACSGRPPPTAARAGVLPGGDLAGTQALWSACAHLQRLGYPVIVLDGTEQETADAPGLQDLLQPPAAALAPCPWAPKAPTAWPPCRPRGLLQLAHRARQQGCRALDLLHRHCATMRWSSSLPRNRS
jgi:hypothetical protein